jgi:hypothetical protein
MWRQVWFPIFDPDAPVSFDPVVPDIPEFGFKTVRKFWDAISRYLDLNEVILPAEWRFGPPSFKVLPPISREFVAAIARPLQLWLKSDGPAVPFESDRATDYSESTIRRRNVEASALEQYKSPPETASPFPVLWATVEVAPLSRARAIRECRFRTRS